MSFDILKSAISALTPPPNIDILNFADTYFFLGSGSEIGKYSSDRTPFWKEALVWLSPQDPSQRVVIIGGTQIGKTIVGVIAHMYYIQILPADQATYCASDKIMKLYAESKINTTIKLMKFVSKVIVNGKFKDADGNIFEKIYKDKRFVILNGKTDDSYISGSYQFVNVDDIDRFPWNIAGQGSPLKLVLKRNSSFGVRGKLLVNSSPTIKGKSHIDKAYQSSDQRRYFMPCPHCTPKDLTLQNKSNMVAFERDNFQYEQDDEYNLISDVTFGCPHCGTLIEEYEKTWMMNPQNGAKTIAENPKSPHKGLRIPSYYSPIGMLSWKDIFTERLEALRDMKNGDNTGMITWTNTVDARAWEEEAKSMDTQLEELLDRREEYKAEVPEGVFLLTCGVDTQNTWMEATVIGWGKGLERWTIAHKTIYGDPNDPKTIKELDEFLNRDFVHESGRTMRIFTTAIDSGGGRTKAIYDYCAPRFLQRVYAIKGIGALDKSGTSIDSAFVKMKFNEFTKDANKLGILYVNAIKDRIEQDINIIAGGRCMHFPKNEDFNEKYFYGLTCEVKNKDGRWENVSRGRNEPLDCYVYAIGAFELIDGLDIELLTEPHYHSSVTASQTQREQSYQHQDESEDEPISYQDRY